MNYDREVQYINSSEIVGQKILCDVDRVCEVEDQVNVWHEIWNVSEGSSITQLPILCFNDL